MHNLMKMSVFSVSSKMKKNKKTNLNQFSGPDENALPKTKQK